MPLWSGSKKQVCEVNTALIAGRLEWVVKGGSVTLAVTHTTMKQNSLVSCYTWLQGCALRL